MIQVFEGVEWSNYVIYSGSCFLEGPRGRHYEAMTYTTDNAELYGGSLKVLSAY